MAGSERAWVRAKVLTAQERAAAATCERFIVETGNDSWRLRNRN